jgi:hypothetical protein
LENETNSRVSTVRFDGAPELGSGEMGDHLHHCSIAVPTTASYAHQQNGKAERYTRTLIDGMQTLLADSKLPSSFWGWAVSTVQYLRNRLPTSVFPAGATLFEALKKRKPNLSHLQVWGCQCFVLIPPELHVKGGPRHYEAIFVGYDEDHIGWCACDLKGACHFSRDIVFKELVPGHLSPPCHSVLPSSSDSSPSSRPVCSCVCTAGGQAFADLIHARDVALASRCSGAAHGGVSLFSLSHILDFVSLVDYNSFSQSSFVSSLDSISFPSFLSFDFSESFLAFLSTDPARFLRAPPSNSWKLMSCSSANGKIMRCTSNTGGRELFCV